MIKLFFAEMDKFNEDEIIGKWVELPISNKEIEEIKEKYVLHETRTDIKNLEIDEYDDIEELNEFILKYNKLRTYEKEEIEAII